MKEIRWLDFCNPCKSWCCHNENPFASKSELDKLKVEKIITKKDGSCIFLDDSGKCGSYQDRPIECRIFPMDIQKINGKLVWVVWDRCPATRELDCDKMVDLFEKTFSREFAEGYIRKYVEYHKSNQPEKYSDIGFRVIREVKGAYQSA